jgi:hypothetical protein
VIEDSEIERFPAEMQIRIRESISQRTSIGDELRHLLLTEDGMCSSIGAPSKWINACGSR